MEIDSRQRTYILENIGKKSVADLARELGLKERKIRKFIERHREHEKAHRPPQIPEEKKEKTNLKSIILPVIFIIILGFIVYANSIGGMFLLDDDLLIIDNTYVKSFTHLGKLFREDLGKGIGVQSSYYRPLQMLTYMVDYHFWKLDPRPYHVTNIILHILAALAVFWMARLLLESDIAAFFASSLFLVHPIHPESVAYISGRGDCMVGFFTVLSFVLYMKMLETRPAGLSHLKSGDASVYTALFLIYVIALFSKENSLMLPPLFILYHYAYKKNVRPSPLIALTVIAVAYFMFRAPFLRSSAAGFSVENVIRRIPGIFIAMAGYMRILLLPFDLHMGYESRTFPFADLRVFLGMAVVGALLFWAWRSRNKEKVIFFSILWFFINIAPVSNIFPLAFYMADHYLYLPSIGFFMIVAFFLKKLYDNRQYRIFSLAVFAGLLVFYSYLTVRQNAYWSGPAYFYERTLKFQPKSARSWSNLGKIYLKRGDKERSIELFKKAIEIDPRFSTAYYNLGVAYNMTGRPEEAVECCKKAIEYDPTFTHAYNIIGTVYWSQGRKKEATEYFKRSLEISPSNVIALCNLAVGYAEEGRTEEATKMLQQAIRANPDYSLAYANLGLLYSNAGRDYEAVEMLERAVMLNPSDASALNNLGKAYYGIGEREKAEAAVKRALELEPSYEGARANLEAIRKGPGAGK